MVEGAEATRSGVGIREDRTSGNDACCRERGLVQRRLWGLPHKRRPWAVAGGRRPNPPARGRRTAPRDRGARPPGARRGGPLREPPGAWRPV